MSSKKKDKPVTEPNQETPVTPEENDKALEAADKEVASEVVEEKVETVPRDQYLRMLAEYENYRKRTQKEKEEAFGRGEAFAITGLLPVIDNLERALRSAKDPEDPFVKGVQMTYDQMMNSLSAIGISKMEALGQTFDPHYHEAIMHVDDETKGENEITDVIQNGYLFNDTVLRTAMVKVAN